ncbi:MAG TPA: CvpA family protein [Candidatus Krumholzibacteria bacterium]|nr:CvpA family protein [Candidatus Krumholzibacteria bacterium]HPD71100.1 CvpA family protein [Candidatus Krumholzibacteria bacterium]HRY39200.1 CvpA family protein [Candidatus Krumholzibacteria bacterium]
MSIWLCVVLIALCGFLGWRGGIVRRVVELLGVVVAIVGSARLASTVAPWLDARLPMGEATALVAAYVVLFAVFLVAVLLAARGVAALVHRAPLGWIDRAGGALCGALIGLLLVSVALIAVGQTRLGGPVRETFTRHPVGNVIYRAAPAVYQGARWLFGGQVDEVWRRAVEVGDQVIEEAGDK